MRPSQTPVPEDVSPILLVDDDATNLEVLRQTLGGSNYRLFVARNGEDAVRIARRARPMVILLDVVMPGIDGYETCRRLKEDPETRDAAVIFLSALTDPKDKVRGFEAGAVDFITKPFIGDEVIARVNTHLVIQRLLRRQAEARPHDGVHGATGPTTMAPLAYDATDAATMGPLAANEDAPAESVFRTGDVVAFRFRIVRYLARGGMGELYEAEDLELRERVALKTILSTVADSERSIALFKREVHLARQVTHPNVCRIYDVFRHRPPGAEGPAQDVVFLAMELLRGETLADKLHREQRLQTTDILPIARQMAAGLAAAHRVGVVHRDFKSLNVMLVESNAADQDMRVVVTDFGLARRTAQDGATVMSMSLAEADAISGTPAYMAPEQVEGGDVTPATDVYALGVVLYELVTGVCPFVADTAIRTAIKRLQEPPPPPSLHVPDLDPRWQATILRCLARQPADRFSNVLDVVTSLEAAGVEEAAAKHPLSRRWPVSAGSKVAVFSLIAAVLLVAIALIAGRVWLTRASTTAPLDSLAVLPFVNVGADPNAEYLSDGLTENLINSFSQLPKLRVVPRSTVFRYKGRELDLQAIGRELTVRAVLTGRVVQRGDTLNIQTDLVDVASDSQLWGHNYTRTLADLITVQGEIATAVSDKLRFQPNAHEQKGLLQRYTQNPEAHQLYLRGQFYWNRRTVPALKRAVEYFQQAIDKDPDYALAWAGLADCYGLYGTYGAGSPRETVPQGKEAAMTALRINETVAEAHTALGWIKMTYDWDWSGAEREFRRAIELNPHNGGAVSRYASYLDAIGRPDDAIPEANRAQQIEPLSLIVGSAVGRILYRARRYDQAISELRKILDLDPNFTQAHLYLGQTYEQTARYEDAIAELQKALALSGDEPAMVGALGHAYAVSGKRAEAEKALLTLKERSTRQYVAPFDIAVIYAGLGARDSTFEWLEKAYEDHSTGLAWLKVDPRFDSARDDPRYRDLLRRMNLPE